MTAAVLSVRALTRRFGGVTAVSELDLDVNPGEVLGVIGPNGAGKSTLVALVSGALAASSGSVSLDGKDITGLDAARRARLGIGRTHQIPRPFARISVLDNLLLAASNVSRGRSAHERKAGCLEILDRTGLLDVASQPAGQLTLLRRKRLELARAMALRPRVLLLDEIGAGLVESETRDLIDLITRLRGEVEAMLVIEHVMDVITACCDRTAVLDFGRLIATGPTREVLADATVAAVYLGTAAADHAPSPEAAGRAASPEAAVPPSRRGDETAGLGPVAASRQAVSSLVNLAAPAADRPLLAVEGLSVKYGELRALRGVDLTVSQAQTVTLLGANGAGKTTLAQAISGALRADGGRIVFDGHDITGMRADRVTALGIAQCLEGRRIFGTLTVEENLILGAGPAPAAVRRRRLDSVYEVFPALAEMRGRAGTAMSGGQQQMLAIGRALMSSPRLLILDEISLGLAPIAVDSLYLALAALKASGVAMILIEQNIARGLSLADRAYVLARGQVALSGSAAEVGANPVLSSLYVGESVGG